VWGDSHQKVGCVAREAVNGGDHDKIAVCEGGHELKAAGSEKIFREKITGTTADRPQLKKPSKPKKINIAMSLSDTLGYSVDNCARGGEK
jgi:hypothetical protein